MECDEELIREATLRQDGASVHHVRTWIGFYKMWVNDYNEMPDETPWNPGHKQRLLGCIRDQEGRLRRLCSGLTSWEIIRQESEAREKKERQG